MKRVLRTLSICLFLATGLSVTVNAQQNFKTTRKSVIGYLEYLPKDYKSNSEDYPLVIFLHGIGERGPNSTDPKKLEKGSSELTKLGPPYHVKKGTQFPFILISPQLKSNYGDWPSWYILEVIEHVKSYLRVDERRIYLTGLSLGGGGVWTAAEDYPDLFAAVAPVCGSRNSTKKAEGIAKNNLPVWAFHGDKDNVVPLSRSAAMVNAINGFGPNPKAKLSVYPGVKHDAWYNAYRPDHGKHKPNVYEWMLSFRKGTTSHRGENSLPTVDAGKDISASKSQSKVEIQGRASDSDGKVAILKWTKSSGGSVKMEGENSSKLIISSYSEGTYVFRLTATDNDGGKKYDEVKVTITKPSNKAPTVNGGSDITATTKDSKVVFQASASDSDGSIKKWQWKQQSGGKVKLEGAQSSKLTVSKFSEGSYAFRITVTDNNGATKYDDVKLTIRKASSENSKPSVDAGKDVVVSASTSKVYLQGSASDRDGSIKKYQWKQQEGSRLKMEKAQTARLEISQFSAGKYRFRLTVTDDKGATNYDEVTVTVNGSKSEEPIQAFAGPDRQIRLPIKDLTMAGGATSSEKIVSYEWRQVSGSSVRLSNAKERIATISNVTSAGSRVFELKAKDAKGRSATDRITITFIGATASSFGEAVVVSNPDPAEEEVSEEAGFSAEESPKAVHWTDKYVVVFNDRGERIFAGKWQEDSFAQVFSTSGLYIYHVRGEGEGIKKGKLYIQ